MGEHNDGKNQENSTSCGPVQSLEILKFFAAKMVAQISEDDVQHQVATSAHAGSNVHKGYSWHVVATSHPPVSPLIQLCSRFTPCPSQQEPTSQLPSPSWPCHCQSRRKMHRVRTSRPQQAYGSCRARRASFPSKVSMASSPTGKLKHSRHDHSKPPTHNLSCCASPPLPWCSLFLKNHLLHRPPPSPSVPVVASGAYCSSASGGWITSNSAVVSFSANVDLTDSPPESRNK